MTAPRFVRAEALLNWYSARANRKWILEGPGLEELLAKVNALPGAPTTSGPTRYRGLYFALRSSTGDLTRYVCHDGLVQNLSNGSTFKDTSSVAEDVYKRCPQPPCSLDDATVSASANLLPIRGLEAGSRVLGGLVCPEAPEYAGAQGEWLAYENMNNCYNYANNVCITDDFGPSNPDNDTVFDGPMSVRRNMEEDELNFLATFPDVARNNGHFFAALWRPATQDYHCIRLDRDGTWSHKDGGSPVTNRRADGNLFGPDLRRVQFPFDSQLVGYFHTAPGVSRLKNALGALP